MSILRRHAATAAALSPQIRTRFDRSAPTPGYLAKTWCQRPRCKVRERLYKIGVASPYRAGRHFGTAREEARATRYCSRHYLRPRGHEALEPAQALYKKTATLRNSADTDIDLPWEITNSSIVLQKKRNMVFTAVPERRCSFFTGRKSCQRSQDERMRRLDRKRTYE